jgi:hypothetical protein
MLRKYDMATLCTYDVTKFSASLVMHILRTHPEVIGPMVLRPHRRGEKKTRLISWAGFSISVIDKHGSSAICDQSVDQLGGGRRQASRQLFAFHCTNPQKVDRRQGNLAGTARSMLDGDLCCGRSLTGG